MPKPTNQPLSAQQIDAIREMAQMQFSPAECEVGMGLKPGTIDRDPQAMSAFLQARIKAQAVIRRVLYDVARGSESAANGDARAADRFLALGDGMEVEAE